MPKQWAEKYLGLTISTKPVFLFSSRQLEIPRYALHWLHVSTAIAVPSHPGVTQLCKMQDKHDLQQKAESKTKAQQSSKAEDS